ncbi:Polygalacturonase protein [Dioscorea alata]|uniref:Polygalacturonase protein n=1 Tax=Dioscorea alata TaxID=55571 RepID=A0ACB7UA60_DIOAL|nr:Polygalacturonase protein [Dioscorea alata]
MSRLVAGVTSVYNVLDFGAVGDGQNDDSKAFLEAWGKTCANAGYSTLVIPSGKTFLLSKLMLQGPCKSNLHVQIMVFFQCNDLKVKEIKLKDSPGKHLSIDKSIRVEINGVTITSPGDSPNTDGIYLGDSLHVQVIGCTIATGDDCIAIGSGCMDINVTQITCGPGHGISIGSLGIDGSTSRVVLVHVFSCNLFNTTNGVRIKTWQGGSGYAKGLSFINVNMTAVRAPIVIDQYYCPHETNCPNKSTAVQLSDVKYVGIHGTSTGEVPLINLACSDVAPCTGLIMSDIHLETPSTIYPPKPYCSNANGRSIGSVIPSVPCLS